MRKILIVIFFLAVFLFEASRYILIGGLMYLDYLCLLFLIANMTMALYRGSIRARKTTSAALLLLGMIHFSPIPRLLFHNLEYSVPSPSKLPKDIGGIIVLGGSFSLEESDRDQIIHNLAGTRIFEWLPLLKHYPQAKIFFTGTPLESHLAEKLFLDLGLSKKQLIFESESKNTLENAKNSLHIQNGKPWILVTSAFHMLRSYKIFKDAAYHVIPYPVNYFTNQSPSQKRFFSFLNKLNPLAWRVMIKERGALLNIYLQELKSQRG